MKNTALKFINPILATLFLLTIIVAGLYKFGPAAWRGTETLAVMHQLSGILFFFVALIHIYLNWAWIKTNIFGIKKKKRANS